MKDQSRYDGEDSVRGAKEQKVFDPLVKLSDDLFTLLLCTNNLNGTGGGTLATYTRLNAGWFLGRR